MSDKKPRKITGRVKLLMAVPYKDHMIYIRQIDENMFEYLVSKSPIYSSWIEMLPRKGKKKLSQNDINLTAKIPLSGAMATVEMLCGERVDAKTLAQVEAFEKAGEKVLNTSRRVN